MEILAQFVTNILAFLLLLAILKKFAWGTVLKLIDDRQKKIASEFAAIEQGNRTLGCLKADYQERLTKIEEEARAKIQGGIAEGRRVAVEIEEEARAAARRTLEKTKESVALEVAKARAQLKEQVVDLAIQVNHKVLQQHLNEETDRRMIESFIREINAMEGARPHG